MKGPGNTNGISAPAGDGRHTGKVSLQPQLVTAPHHANTHPCETYLAAKDSAFPSHP